MDLAALQKMAPASVPDSGTPPSEPDGDEGMEGLIPVPLESLAQPDENESMQSPGEGDAGTMQVEFTVAKVDGDTAWIKPTAINGKPVGEDPDADQATDQAPPMDEQTEGLQDQLQKNGGFPQ